jgi:hypothetical protein
MRRVDHFGGRRAFPGTRGGAPGGPIRRRKGRRGRVVVECGTWRPPGSGAYVLPAMVACTLPGGDPPSRASRQMDVADRRRLHSAPSGSKHSRRPQATLGEAASSRTSHTVPGLTSIFVTAAEGRNPSQSSKTSRTLARTSERESLWPGQTLPGTEESGTDESNNESAALRSGFGEQSQRLFRS